MCTTSHRPAPASSAPLSEGRTPRPRDGHVCEKASRGHTVAPPSTACHARHAPRAGTGPYVRVVPCRPPCFGRRDLRAPIPACPFLPDDGWEPLLAHHDYKRVLPIASRCAHLHRPAIVADMARSPLRKLPSTANASSGSSSTYPSLYHHVLPRASLPFTGCLVAAAATVLHHRPRSPPAFPVPIPLRTDLW
jgi:hypothetical protein